MKKTDFKKADRLEEQFELEAGKKPQNSKKEEEKENNSSKSLAKALKKYCTFVVGLWEVWSTEFTFTLSDDENTFYLGECVATPEFPASADFFVQNPASNMLCDKRRFINYYNEWKMSSDFEFTLADLLPPVATSGFRLLVQHVDTIATLHGISLQDIELKDPESKTPLDNQDVTILYEGSNSVVLLPFDTASHVYKVSHSETILFEQQIHNIVDQANCLHVLRSEGTADVGGVPGLAFIKLTPFVIVIYKPSFVA